MKYLHYKSIRWNYLLWWWFAILTGFFVELISGNFEPHRLLNLIENHFFAFILISIPLVLKPSMIKRILENLLFSFFVIFTFAETLYFNWFGANFSASSIFVLFETNVAEASEFISFYINPFSIVYGLFTFLYIISFWIYRKKTKTQFKPIANRIVIILLIGSCLVFLRITKLIDQNFPYLVARGVDDYQTEQENLAGLAIDEKFGSFKAVHSSSQIPRTFVLMIGESTTKKQFELYGYPRQNNPKLSSRNDQLSVFEDVISTNAFTIGALKTALSLNNFKTKNESTIVQLFNQAGFETHWISNQRPIGPYESIVTKISRAAEYYTYTNTALAGKKTPLDEVLLPHLASTLKRSTKDKFIVLHLLGTHLQYKDRYPKNFNKFKDTPPNLKFVHEEAIQKRNEYDNAVLYNDYLIDQVIQQVEKQEGESYVLYFSDHGEEVFLNQDFAGHNDDNPTPSMFEIPFILWTNEEFKSNFKRDFQTENSYSLIDFIHSLADLSSIQFEEFQPQKSIFSKEFILQNRKIKDTIQYHEFLKSFNE
jgi:heptose-I-phosphate ethanolaminephosphotransferase